MTKQPNFRLTIHTLFQVNYFYIIQSPKKAEASVFYSLCFSNMMLYNFICSTVLTGVGTVVSGTNLLGTIKVNDTVMLGPDALGHFHPIAIKSIHRKR